MSNLVNTPFGKGMTFSEIEKCREVTPADRKAILDMSDPQAVQTLLMVTPPRPKAITTDEDILMVLRGINFNAGSRSEDMVSLRIWLNAKHIIVSQNLPVRSVDVIQERLATYATPVEVMISLTDEIFNRIESHISEIDGRVDEAEDLALENPDQKHRAQIMNFRRELIALRRYLLPQRETMMTLSRSTSKLLSGDDRETLTNQYYRAARICDQLDALRERLSLIQEEITAILSDRMNKNMYLLSIISLVFLPLGFITGLFGINVDGMPWTGTPLGFVIVCGLCIAAAGFILAVMRKQKWI
ncbi:CorA family divalent cation transporter [Litorimonas sp. RW-G-Af-16]|uniref:CorA family divalent cation transporter n=1 Tax=Litorimonas sp. RW-G-Af-16 TaxID=3241168 RepID=UPI00390CBB87